MTTNTDIVNRALQVIGTRTTVTDAELLAGDTNEAIQASLILEKYRDQLLRMAPWNCGVAYANLPYITSQPGTPENQSPYTSFWTPGQPPLGWAYEYMYPDDCLRACFVVPSMQTGFAGGVPIYPTPTNIGTGPTLWQGPAINYKVQLDQYFREASGAVTIVSGGSGFAVNDTLICGGAPSTSGALPAGLVQIKVTGVAAGVITTATLQAFTNLNKTSLLYAVPTYDLDQVSSSGLGTGAVVSVGTVSATRSPARVILTNQEFASLAYVKQVTDPNVMDPDFVEAWVNVLGAGLCNPLSGDKGLAKMAIALANEKIAEARKADGNEGLTVNDVTPDWLRIRGIDFANNCSGFWNNFDWGASWPG